MPNPILLVDPATGRAYQKTLTTEAGPITESGSEVVIPVGTGGGPHTHDWQDITGEPATYAPTPHGHGQSDVSNLVTDLVGKAASLHSHGQGDITNLASDLAGKAASSHIHPQSDITGLVTDLAGKADTAHTHPSLDTIAYKSSDQTNIGTAYANVTGVGLPVVAGKSYAFEFVLICDADATTTGIDVACTGPASPISINYVSEYWTSATVITSRPFSVYDGNAASTGSNGAARAAFRVRGILVNGSNAGTLIARIKRENVGSGPNVRAGSYGRLTPLN